MYTCCPICKTNFNVTEAQLQVAQGKVRCGSCKNVFNARQHIHYRPLKPTKPVTPPAQTDKTEIIPEQTQAKTDFSFTADKTNDKPAEQTTAPASDKKEKTSDIDAIFNALDTQLTSGTYIDIAKPVEEDIREADFDVDFESEGTDQEKSSKPDINITEKNIANQETLDTNNDTMEPDVEVDDVHLDSSTEINKSLKEKVSTKQPAGRQQHTFDFISLPDEPNLSEEDEQQLASVNKPLEEKKQDESSKNAALHEAIDNIIKVDNNTTTPYEEHDDDHFVIEMQTHPDVELVDEDDIDKLFASTDSLKISDLKFDKFKADNHASEGIASTNDESTLDEAHDADVEAESEEELAVIEYHEEETRDFNQQAEEQLNPDNFLSDAERFDEQPVDEFDSETENEYDVDNNQKEQIENFEEEIVLSSEPEPETNIPHRLRDAVASLEQPEISTGKKLAYIVASAVLILVLLFQLVLFKSTTLANSFPALQPMLVSMCNKLPCRYTGNHNSKQIKILNRDVRLHPKIKGALLISATIMNQASYTQPYPTILLKFTDLTGSTVAQRYFLPKEYLGLLNKPFALMPSKKPVQLNIEILDPGSDAINFQFFFL